MIPKPVALALCTLMVAGCGTEPLAYASLEGTYSGAFSTTEPGGARFDGDFELIVEQTEESLSGPFTIDGTITGWGTRSTTAQGGWSGTLPLGASPTFEADLAYDFCPHDIMTFSANYNSSSGTLTLVGDLDIPSSQCDILTSYPLTVVLTR